jgi:hypothetical protein
VTHSCPKSYVTAQSLAWIEEFWAWKLIGNRSYGTIAARTVEAFGLLESEWKKVQAA